MSLTNLQDKSKVVGINETNKAIKQGKASQIFIARDADKHIISDIEAKCQKHQIQLKYVDTMKELGQACGINVNAATACLLN